MKHTYESVTEDIRAEYKNLSRSWSRVGDINDIEYGGIRYRKGHSENEIEYILYIGLNNCPKGYPNKHVGSFYLNDALSELDKIWSYADVENCGLCIGWLAMSLDKYCNFLRE